MQIEQTGLRGAAASWFFAEVAKVASDAGACGQPAMIERSGPAGAMAPLHTRDVDESYSVLEGDVTFYIDGEAVPASAGDVVVAPSGRARTFRVVSDSARWLVVTRVQSLERFQDFGRAVSAPAEDPEAGWPSADEHAAVAAIAEPNGIKLLGPPGLLTRPA